MSKKLINFVNITKAYGDNVILDDLNLYIRENEFLRTSSAFGGIVLLTAKSECDKHVQI